ncbi:hypothetical protein TI05_12200 [Achromatium sp. WMS3]|nr:hypothetical protein TI05_12200 [Achromatium sp. WMS3]
MKFHFISPFHNHGDYILEHYESIRRQTYQNWEIIYINDASTNDTVKLIPKDDRITLISNSKRYGPLFSRYHGITHQQRQPDDIMVLLDSDDCLLDDGALDYLATQYQQDYQLGYGNFYYSTGKKGCTYPYSYENFNRDYDWRGYHLCSFRYGLYAQFLAQDPNLLSYKDNAGNFFTRCTDFALFTPLLELCAHNNLQSFMNERPIMWYRVHPNNIACTPGQRTDVKNYLDSTVRPRPALYPT